MEPSAATIPEKHQAHGQTRCITPTTLFLRRADRWTVVLLFLLVASSSVTFKFQVCVSMRPVAGTRASGSTAYGTGRASCRPLRAGATLWRDCGTGMSSTSCPPRGRSACRRKAARRRKSSASRSGGRGGTVDVSTLNIFSRSMAVETSARRSRECRSQA